MLWWWKIIAKIAFAKSWIIFSNFPFKPPITSCTVRRCCCQTMRMEPPTMGNQRLGFAAYQVVILVMCALILQSLLLPSKIGLDMEFLTHELDSSSPSAYDNPLAIPRGQAQNLPSVRTSQDFERDESGTNYGGVGDAKHLGGFTDIDMMGISPAVWKHIVKNWTVQSVIDVGCGRGISTSWFYVHGLRTECVEGSHDAIEQSMVPDKSEC